jgi:hypothetical protein
MIKHVDVTTNFTGTLRQREQTDICYAKKKLKYTEGSEVFDWNSNSNSFNEGMPGNKTVINFPYK